MKAFCTSQEMGTSAHTDVRIPFPYLGNDWMDCVEIWYVVREILAMRFTQRKKGAVHESTTVMNQLARHFLHVTSGVLCACSCARLFFVSRYPCWMHRAEIWCVVRPIKYAFDTAHKWMISTSAQVQPNILLKTHLFASAGLSPKRRLTRVIRR